MDNLIHDDKTSIIPPAQHKRCPPTTPPRGDKQSNDDTTLRKREKKKKQKNDGVTAASIATKRYFDQQEARNLLEPKSTADIPVTVALDIRIRILEHAAVQLMVGGISSEAAMNKSWLELHTESKFHLT